MYEKGSYDEEPKESLASNLIRSCSFPVTQSNMCSAVVTKEQREGTLAYNARSTKSSDDFTGSPGRKTRPASVSDASLATNITEESSDASDRYSLLSLALPTSGGISI